MEDLFKEPQLANDFTINAECFGIDSENIFKYKLIQDNNHGGANFYLSFKSIVYNNKQIYLKFLTTRFHNIEHYIYLTHGNVKYKFRLQAIRNFEQKGCVESKNMLIIKLGLAVRLVE